MTKLRFPFVEVDNNCFQLTVDLGIYAKETIIAACYKFSNHYHIHQVLNDTHIKVFFESKKDNTITEDNVKQFCNELIDQQLRYNTEKQFGKIRDMIVEEAFKPLNK